MERQAEIKSWFDQNYRRQGFDYLRPVEAYAIFLKLLEFKRGDSLLDVACGPGLMLRQALDHGGIATGVDISDVAIEMARDFVPEADVRTANAEQLPFSNESFDTVTCLGSLERMVDVEQVLAEIYRVTKANGRLCFLVRNSNNITWSLLMRRLGLQNKQGHQGANSMQAWQHIFVAAGFTIEDVLPDQWPFVRWGQFLSLGLYKPDVMKIRRGIRPLKYAYEYLFILKKPHQ